MSVWWWLKTGIPNIWEEHNFVNKKFFPVHSKRSGSGAWYFWSHLASTSFQTLSFSYLLRVKCSHGPNVKISVKIKQEKCSNHHPILTLDHLIFFFMLLVTLDQERRSQSTRMKKNLTISFLDHSRISSQTLYFNSNLEFIQQLSFGIDHDFISSKLYYLNVALNVI